MSNQFEYVNPAEGTNIWLTLERIANDDHTAILLPDQIKKLLAERDAIVEEKNRLVRLVNSSQQGGGPH